MPIQTHRRPELREPVLLLLSTLIPVVRDGGEVPLADLFAATLGHQATRALNEARERLNRRGAFIFTPLESGARFFNEGEAAKIRLARFALRIPRRVSGEARLLPSEGGAALRFHNSETLYAEKLIFSLRLEAIEATPSRIYVDMEGDAFDQRLTLV